MHDAMSSRLSTTSAVLLCLAPTVVSACGEEVWTPLKSRRPTATATPAPARDAPVNHSAASSRRHQ